MECPISGEICGKHCAWFIDNECLMKKISYSLMIVSKELGNISGTKRKERKQ